MRKGTLLALSFVIAFPIVYFARELLGSMGYGVGPRWQIGTGAFASVVLAPFVALLLTPINNRILAWRRQRGRDIAEEERYESEYGMIGLMPRSDDEPTRK